MGQQEIQDLLVEQSKAAGRMAGLARRGVAALAVVAPVLARVGSRLASTERLLWAERTELAEKVAEAMQEAVNIMDGKAAEDDDG